MKGKYLHFYHFSVLEWWPTSPGWKVQEFLQTGVLVLRNKTSLMLGKRNAFLFAFLCLLPFWNLSQTQDDITCFIQAGDLVLPNEAWKGDVCWFVLLSMFAFYSFLRISQMKHVDRKESLKSKMIILAVVPYMFSTGQLLLANLWGVLGKSGKE